MVVDEEGNLLVVVLGNWVVVFVEGRFVVEKGRVVLEDGLELKKL